MWRASIPRNRYGRKTSKHPLKYRANTSLLLLLCLGFYVRYAHAQLVRPYAPELFPPGVSGAVCGFADGGKTIVFVREDTVAGRLVLYEATKRNGKWVDERRLPFSGDYNDYGGRLTENGHRLYFSSDRPGGSSRPNDAWNLWTVERRNGTWASPLPLTTINNRGDECCPVPFKDKLIFSGTRSATAPWQIYSTNQSFETEMPIDSLNGKKTWQWPSFFDVKNNLLLLNSMRRPEGQGQDDVYFARFTDGNFGTPVNLTTVNTKQFEDGAVLTPNRKYLIFCQHETGSTPSRVMYVRWRKAIKATRSLEFKARQ